MLGRLALVCKRSLGYVRKVLNCFKAAEHRPQGRKYKQEFHKDAIVGRYGGENDKTFFTGKFTSTGKGIFSKYPTLDRCRNR